MALTFSLWSIEDSVYAHTFGVSVLFSVASICDSVSAMTLSLPLISCRISGLYSLSNSCQQAMRLFARFP
jgi:hypothetical protein